MKTALLALGLGTLLMATGVQAEETPETEAGTDNKPTVETIRVEGSLGTLEEERVPAMRSEIRYVPSGQKEGYSLIGSNESQSESQNAHQDDDMLIPSWNLFSW